MEEVVHTEKKKRTGKRKIEIKPIINKTSKQVTFSKRRTGLFKKASELGLLCGSEIAIITFSGAGKLFSFGHPTADAVIHRYINQSNCINVENSNDDNGNYNENNFGQLSEQYKKVLSNIEVEKRKADVAPSSSSSNGGLGFWWDQPIDNLGVFELEQLKNSLEGFRDEICSRIGSSLFDDIDFGN
ncbi:hypothetical protein SOVF_209410 [Spinacia oleracea]|uniref:Agamous-like MADS-box protein AGL62 n=1 Tax=Spinacia oleracea TaxID=3562 RepID=A0A9R0K0M8_SPIOL|nr:agamous-like MADS-box protein AGL62 [Spinacia oleracea]KNA03419.1 hypothetical protein SOVF_209410 [Spinacia oleracea]